MKVTEEMVKRMHEMRRNGMTNADISKAMEISYQTTLVYLGKQPTGSDIARQTHYGYDLGEKHRPTRLQEIGKVVISRSGRFEATIKEDGVSLTASGIKYSELLELMVFLQDLSEEIR